MISCYVSHWLDDGDDLVLGVALLDDGGELVLCVALAG